MDRTLTGGTCYSPVLPLVTVGRRVLVHPGLAVRRNVLVDSGNAMKYLAGDLEELKYQRQECPR